MAPCLDVAARGNPEVSVGITGMGHSEAQNKMTEGNRRYSQEGETPEGWTGGRGQGRWPAVIAEGVAEVGREREIPRRVGVAVGQRFCF